MMYELWDTDSGNLIQTYEFEIEAVALVRSAIGAYGTSYATSLALLVGSDHGDLVTVAAGDELASRALAAEPPAVKSR